MKTWTSMRRVSGVLAMIAAAGTCSAALRTQQASAPASTPAKETSVVAEAMQAKVETVQGNVAVQFEKGGKWTPAKVGMVLKEGSTIRTGPRSFAQVRISDTQLISIDRLSFAQFERVERKQAVNETDIGLGYGRVLFNVTSTEFANDVTIKAPDATLAVKGTVGGMEYTGGQRTLAFGDPTNRGRIEIDYQNGGKAVIQDDSASSSDDQDPANRTENGTYVDPQNSNARDDGEWGAAERVGGGLLSGLFDGLIPGGEFGSTEIMPGDVGPIPGRWFMTADLEAGEVLRRDLLTDEQTSVADLPLGESIGGLAVRRDEEHGGFQLLLLEGGHPELGPNDPRLAFNELWVLSLDENGEPISDGKGGSQFELLARFADGDPGEGVEDAPILSGLGIVENEIYSLSTETGVDHDFSRLVRLDLGDGQTPAGLSDIADFGQGFSGRSLASSVNQSSLFVTGTLAGSGFEDGGLLANKAILQIDPRNNYIIDSLAGIAGDFRIVGGTRLGPNFDPSTLTADSIDFESSTFINGRLVLAVRATNADTGVDNRVFITINPNRGSNGSAVSRISGGRNRGVSGIAGAPRGRNQPPVELLNPSTPIDNQTINALFAGLAFSERSLRSGALQRMVGQEIIGTSIDPSGCAASQLIAMIPETMLRHINETSGVGRTVAELRDNLPNGHPCLPAGGRRNH